MQPIAALQGQVKLTPPKGAEFGKTEVFYLNVEAESRPRAVALAGAICKQLQARSQDLRDQKAQSLIAELSKTVDLANADLNATTDALTQVESQVGADLGELRMLNETGGGDSPLHRSVNEMDQELRQAQQTIDGNQELLTLLEASKTDARSLAAAPNRLLEAQPVLRRLKDGLVDAQLRTAQLAGNLMPDHPSLKAAKTAEDEIATRVRSEVDAAIVGVQSELQVAQQRAKLLESQLTDARARLSKLADMRARVRQPGRRAEPTGRHSEIGRATDGRSPGQFGRRSHRQRDCGDRRPGCRRRPGWPGQSDDHPCRSARRIDAGVGHRVSHGATLKIGRGGADRRSGAKLGRQSGSPGRRCRFESASLSNRRRQLARKWIVAGARSIFEAGVAKAGGCRLKYCQFSVTSECGSSPGMAIPGLFLVYG